MRIAVIGSGAAGAAATAHLRARGCRVVVLERDEIGGRAKSIDLGGTRVDVGAQFLTNFYTETLTLLRRAHREAALREIPRSIGVAIDDRVHDLLTWRAALGSGILPWPAKLAVVPELILALTRWRTLDVQALWRAADLDTGSLEEAYGRSRGSRVLLDRVVAPAIDNFLYWSPAETSRALSPALVKGALILRHMWTLTDGVGSLPGIFLGDAEVRTGTAVTGVRESGPAVSVTTADGREERYDGAVIAIPAAAVGSVWTQAPDRVAELLSGVTYSRTTVLSARLGRRVAAPTNGVMFAGDGGKPVAAVTVASRRNAPDLPPGEDVVQIFSTEATAGHWAQSSDHEILESAGRMLAGLNGGAFDPRNSIRDLHVQRWDPALPKFRPGYLAALRSVQPWLRSAGRVRIAGDYLSGPFVEGAVTSGIVAARAVLEGIGAGSVNP
ncbi:MAG: FAD-dependent oxidoreductase [Actinoplanes sp.]